MSKTKAERLKEFDDILEEEKEDEVKKARQAEEFRLKEEEKRKQEQEKQLQQQKEDEEKQRRLELKLQAEDKLIKDEEKRLSIMRKEEEKKRKLKIEEEEKLKQAEAERKVKEKEEELIKQKNEEMMQLLKSKEEEYNERLKNEIAKRELIEKELNDKLIHQKEENAKTIKHYIESQRKYNDNCFQKENINDISFITSTTQNNQQHKRHRSAFNKDNISITSRNLGKSVTKQFSLSQSISQDNVNQNDINNDDCSCNSLVSPVNKFKLNFKKFQKNKEDKEEEEKEENKEELEEQENKIEEAVTPVNGGVSRDNSNNKYYNIRNNNLVNESIYNNNNCTNNNTITIHNKGNSSHCSKKTLSTLEKEKDKHNLHKFEESFIRDNYKIKQRLFLNVPLPQINNENNKDDDYYNINIDNNIKSVNNSNNVSSHFHSLSKPLTPCTPLTISHDENSLPIQIQQSARTKAQIDNNSISSNYNSNNNNNNNNVQIHKNRSIGSMLNVQSTLYTKVNFIPLENKLKYTSVIIPRHNSNRYSHINKHMNININKSIGKVNSSSSSSSNTPIINESTFGYRYINRYSKNCLKKAQSTFDLWDPLNKQQTRNNHNKKKIESEKRLIENKDANLNSKTCWMSFERKCNKLKPNNNLPIAMNRGSCIYTGVKLAKFVSEHTKEHSVMPPNKIKGLMSFGHNRGGSQGLTRGDFSFFN